MHKLKNYLMLVLLLSVANATRAQIDTDRPDQTESAVAMSRGDFQIEAGLQTTLLDETSASSVLPTMQLRYGLLRGLELRMLTQYEYNKSLGSLARFGFSDLQVGTKIQLMRGDAIDMLLLTHFILPTGSEQVTADAFGVTNRLCMSHTWANGSKLGTNLGYNYYDDDDDVVVVTLSYSFGLSEQISMYLEPFADFSPSASELSFDTGLMYVPVDNLQFDISGGIGINHKMAYLTLGTSWLLPNSKNK